MTEELEKLIDRHTLLHVLTALELICDEKADHVEANWHDTATARRWRECARRLEYVASTACVGAVSIGR